VRDRGRPLAIARGSHVVPVSLGTCPVTARTVQGMARVRPGRLLPDPYLLVPECPQRAPGSSVTSRVRSPGSFPLCSLSCGHGSRLRLEGRTRTLSGPSLDLSLVRTLALSACRPTAYLRPALSAWELDRPTLLGPLTSQVDAPGVTVTGLLKEPG
jgi:hypothetical protein